MGGVKNEGRHIQEMQKLQQNFQEDMKAFQETYQRDKTEKEQTHQENKAKLEQSRETEKTSVKEKVSRLEETRNIIRDNIQKLECSNPPIPPNPQPNPQTVPDGFLCPITGEIMKDPVIDNEGISYEREAIKEWLRRGNTTSPITRQPLQLCDLRPNVDLRKSIEDWQKNRNL